MVEHLIFLGFSSGFCRNGVHFNNINILLNAQPSGARAKMVPSGARAKMVPILNRFCATAAPPRLSC